MTFLLQQLVVALVVLACAGYAAWTLAPAGARRRIVDALARSSPGLGARLARRLAPANACACDGCDHGRKPRGAPSATPPGASSATSATSATAPAAATAAPIRFYRRPPT